MDKNMKRLFLICWCVVIGIFLTGITIAVIMGNMLLSGLFGFMLGVFLIPNRFDPAIRLKQWQIDKWGAPMERK